jgi:hypothetical protein
MELVTIDCGWGIFPVCINKPIHHENKLIPAESEVRRNYAIPLIIRIGSGTSLVRK